MAFSKSSNPRARIRSCNPSGDKHTNVKGVQEPVTSPVCERDAVCSSVWVSVVVLDVSAAYPAQACRGNSTNTGRPGVAPRAQCKERQHAGSKIMQPRDDKCRNSTRTQLTSYIQTQHSTDRLHSSAVIPCSARQGLRLGTKARLFTVVACTLIHTINRQLCQC